MEAVGVWLESNKAPGRKVRYREYILTPNIKRCFHMTIMTIEH